MGSSQTKLNIALGLLAYHYYCKCNYLSHKSKPKGNVTFENEERKQEIPLTSDEIQFEKCRREAQRRQEGQAMATGGRGLQSRIDIIEAPDSPLRKPRSGNDTRLQPRGNRNQQIHKTPEDAVIESLFEAPKLLGAAKKG